MYINPDKCVACGNCTYVCPMGAIYIDPEIKRAKVNLDECVECYACYNGLSQEHLNPTLVRTMRRIFQALRLRFDPGARCLSDRRLRTRRAHLAPRRDGAHSRTRACRMNRRASKVAAPKK